MSAPPPLGSYCGACTCAHAQSLFVRCLCSLNILCAYGASRHAMFWSCRMTRFCVEFAHGLSIILVDLFCQWGSSCRHNTPLQHLILRQNQISDAGVSSLWEGLRCVNFHVCLMFVYRNQTSVNLIIAFCCSSKGLFIEFDKIPSACVFW